MAKTLWRSQNGRLRLVDAGAANALLKASLVVDLGAACAIVDSIFASPDGTPYRLSGRSAEAYWVQTVLGMMLPSHEIPLGVVTGRVQMIDGIDEIHHVEGVEKKLEYANSAGFSRVVLPSAQFGEGGVGAYEAGEITSDQEDGSNSFVGRDEETVLLAAVGRRSRSCRRGSQNCFPPLFGRTAIKTAIRGK